MSAPVKDFSKLSLSHMPTTRGQSSRHPRREAEEEDDEEEEKEEEDDDDEEEEEEEKSSDEAPGIVKSRHTDLIYDTSRLSPPTERRVKAALRETFAFGHCSHYNASQPNEYYAFQIFPTRGVSVRIGTPESGYSELQCQCYDEQPCRHIFWLRDQITRHTKPDSRRSPFTLLKHGYATDVEDPFQQIQSFGPPLFEALGCELRNGTSEIAGSIAEEARAASQGSTLRGSEAITPERKRAFDERKAEVRDIMAALSAVTRDEYRPDIFDNIPEDLTLDQVRVDRNLENTLARALIVDDDLFRHLRLVVPSSHSAADYFEKRKEEALKALSRMDAYVAGTSSTSRGSGSGSSAGTGAGSHTDDVEWCANALIRVVNSIRGRVFNPGPTPLAPTAQEKAVDALVTILEKVVERNRNIIAASAGSAASSSSSSSRHRHGHGHSHGHRQQSSSTSSSSRATQSQALDPTRNLYARLIASQPEARFVVNELADLKSALPSFIERLDEIVHVLSSMSPSPSAGVQGYIDTLRALSQAARSAGVSTGWKRRTAGDGNGGEGSAGFEGGGRRGEGRVSERDAKRRMK